MTLRDALFSLGGGVIGYIAGIVTCILVAKWLADTQPPSGESMQRRRW
jgi:hypothetical protein